MAGLELDIRSLFRVRGMVCDSTGPPKTKLAVLEMPRGVPCDERGFTLAPRPPPRPGSAWSPLRAAGLAEQPPSSPRLSEGHEGQASCDVAVSALKIHLED